MTLTIVIATYNRRELVMRAIQSAINWVVQAPIEIQIIVVDDGSTDATVSSISTAFTDQLDSRALSIVPLPENMGVTHAKNAGASVADGEWVLFLDSDDELISDVCLYVLKKLEMIEGPLVYFRCQDAESSEVIGAPTCEELEVTTKFYLGAWVYGDCIPVVRRRCFSLCPYESKLRGFEGLAYLRITRQFGSGLLFPRVVVIVYRGGQDRLSLDASLRRRACELARGHFIVLTEFYACMTLGQRVDRVARIGYHAVRCIMGKIASLF